MMDLSLEEFLCRFMAEIAKSHDEHSNLIKEAQASMDFTLRNQQASIKTLEIQTISTFVKADMPSIRCIDASQYAVSNLQNKNLFSESKKMALPSPNHLNDDSWDESKETNGVKDLEAYCINAKALPRKEKDLLKLDLEARLMGNALWKNRSHDPKFKDYIELDDLDELLELRHDEVVNLGPPLRKVRLVGNLCTLWIGRMHIHTNVVRFTRPPRATRVSQPPKRVVSGTSSYVSAVKGSAIPPPYISPLPALVLDDSCVVNRDLNNFVMGEIKRFSSINNLHVLLSNEGFSNVKLAYLGRLWVMIELQSSKAKAKFMNHVGVASWFDRMCNAQMDFVSQERIVWVDIKGVPLHAWSRETFCKIGSKWGEVIDLEECMDDCFGRKRICIKTKQVDNILERFKIIVLGKVFNVRAKELAVWTPVFKDVNDDLYCSDDESVKESGEIKDGCEESNDAASDVEEVSDTLFGEPDVQHDDPHTQEVNSGMDSSIPFPPGFTPPIRELNSSECHKVNTSPIRNSRIQTDVLSSRVVENAQVVDEWHSTDSHDSRRKTKIGGSIRDVLDNMINVGNTMGYSIEGCIKDMEKIIESQGGRNGLQ
ncbi:RNA-directed DNA polymerase, eukaryota [Tanacetum coccineum]